MENRIVQFPPFRLDLESGELTKDGRAVKLHPQPAQLLALLAGRAGEIVTRDDIKKALWEEETYVDFDLGINSCIRQIRNALEDHADEPRYLETVPQKGYRFIAPLQAPTVDTEPLTKTPKPKSNKLWLGMVAGLAVFGVLALWFLNSKTVELPPTTIPFTKYDGLELEPAFSPDGKQLAFVWNGKEDRRYHLYVKMIGGDEPLQLTKAPHSDYSPAWSPDGREIAFLRQIRIPGQQTVSEVLVVPALGGSERRIGSVAAQREAGEWFDPGLSWSPDGLFLATVHKESLDEQEGVFLISTQTGEKKRLTTPPRDTLMRDRQPIFSPDGRSVAFVRGRGRHGFQLLIQSMDGAGPKLLHEVEGMISDVDWVADGSALVFSAFDERSRLWRFLHEEARRSSFRSAKKLYLFPLHVLEIGSRTVTSGLLPTTSGAWTVLRLQNLSRR